MLYAKRGHLITEHNHMIHLSRAFTFIMISLLIASCGDDTTDTPPPPAQSSIENFSFISAGNTVEGKIYLPASFEKDDRFVSIFLLDYQEQDHEVALDEFDRIIAIVKSIENLDAVVVTLKDLIDLETDPSMIADQYQLFKDMAGYVDDNYTNNSSRTFIGRGSEGGLIQLALLEEDPSSAIFDNFISTDPSDPFINNMLFKIQNGTVPDYVETKKFHFSYSADANIANCRALEDLINEADFDWLNFSSIYYQDNIFEDAYPDAFNDGLQFVFQ